MVVRCWRAPGLENSPEMFTVTSTGSGNQLRYGFCYIHIPKKNGRQHIVLLCSGIGSMIPNLVTCEIYIRWWPGVGD